MYTVFRDHEPGDELLIGIDRYRGFEEMLSHLTGSDGVIMTRVPAGEPGGIDRRNRDRSVFSIESFQGTFEEEVEIDRPDPAEEFLKCGEVGD